MKSKPEQPHDDFETQIQCEEVYTESETGNIINVLGYGLVNMNQFVGDKKKIIMVNVHQDDHYFGFEPSEIENIGTPIDSDGEDI